MPAGLVTLFAGLVLMALAFVPEAPQHAESSEEGEAEILDPDHGKSEGDILDELTGQMKLFSNNDDSKEHETT